MNLVEQASWVTESGGKDDLVDLLSKCLDDLSVEALAAVELVARDMYGGDTHNWNMKMLAAPCLLVWGTQGVTELGKIPKREPTSKNYNIVISLLAQVSAGKHPWCPGMPNEFAEKLRSKLPPVGTLAEEAEATLNELVMTIPEDDALLHTSNALQSAALLPVVAPDDALITEAEPTPDESAVTLPKGGTRVDAGTERQKNQFLTDTGPGLKVVSALALRWLVVSLPVIEEYENLLQRSPDEEPLLQEFLEQHPLLLDPLAVRVWPKPDLHGKKEPDFLLQRADGKYLVIEIETPGKGLMTEANQIGAKVTQAVTQALEYREFLINRFGSASRTFPDFRSPDALVVIGREDVLDDAQAMALRRENEGRSYLKIVGFDALSTRARAMLRNLTHGRVHVGSVRME